MPGEVETQGVTKEPVEQPDGSGENRAPASQDPEPQSVENSNVEQPNEMAEELGVDPAKLSSDPAERDKEWQRAYTKRTQEYSSEVKDLRSELDDLKGKNSTLQSLYSNPEVYKAVAKLYNLNGNGADESAINDLASRMDPNDLQAMKQLIRNEQSQALQPYQQAISKLNAQSQVDKDLRDVEWLEGKGYKVTDDDLRSMDEYIKQNPNASMIDAYKVVSYDTVYEAGSDRTIEDIQNTAGKMVHKPGYNPSNSGSVDDREKSVNEIFEDEKRRGG